MKITIDRDKSVPLYVQLFDQLRHLILSGEWAPGSRLPSETELQHELQISRSTIRQALSSAEVHELIERVPGKGTFVARSPVVHPPASTQGSPLIGYMLGHTTENLKTPSCCDCIRCLICGAIHGIDTTGLADRAAPLGKWRFLFLPDIE